EINQYWTYKAKQNDYLLFKTSPDKHDFEAEKNFKLEEKAAQVVKELIKEEKNGQIKDTLIKIVSSCLVRKYLRVTGRFWYFFVGKPNEGYTYEYIYADLEIKALDHCLCTFNYKEKKNHEALFFLNE
ncbi:15277_t:CDS:2, partial [Racocetra persica]